jgi:alpha-tubulin suppressor-like RCC1 family protein
LGFGATDYGQLGVGDWFSRQQPDKIQWGEKRPTGSARILQVAAGRFHSLVLLEDGSLFSMGSANNGQVGLTGVSFSSKIFSPERIEDLKSERIVQVAAGWFHSLAINDRGELFTWGLSSHYQLGHGDMQLRPQPRRVEALKNVRLVSAGLYHSLAVTG